MPSIDDLYIEIHSESTQAVNGIDALANSLGKLKTITRGGVGLTTIANQIKRFNAALGELTDPSAKIHALVKSLKPLQNIGKSNLNSTLNQLKKLPEITKQLATVDMGAFETQIRRVTDAIRPLANEMNKVAQGFSAFPSRIQRLINQNERLSISNKKTGGSYKSIWNPLTGLIAKTTLYMYAMRRISRMAKSWVIESNNYVENLNLLNVSMREYADEALAYANEVRDAFGIDPSEWIRFQSVFQNMATGFGLSTDKAAVMSKTLTQLGYDLATLFNVDYETAMQKLQSGLAGQPRPMREWGFDMSESTLKLTAMNLGIKENVELMTQYEKSQLRFVQIMETARKQGILQNFSREIITPANALRILNQQVVQLRRALGDMLIPILIKIIPYVQAFVRVLTDAARAIAAFFGFELPQIDYSGLGEVGGAVGDIEDGAEGAEGAVKRLKNTLAGFDEINLLNQSSPTGGSGGSGGIGGIGGSDLGIDFADYDYDFLGNVENEVNRIVDSIYAKIQPVIDFVRDNFEHIKDIGIAIAAGLLAWKIAPAAITLFDAIAGIFKKGGGGTNPVLGITLTIAGITLGIAGLSNLVSGEGDVIDVIKTVIGGALGLGGALIAFGTGPLGWTIGIAAVLTMTIAGFVIGTRRKIDALIQETMGDNGGTLITDLSNAFSKVMEEIGSGLDPIIEGGEKLKRHKENIDRSKESIETLFNVINTNAGDSALELEKLIGAMNNLLNETQLLRDQAYGNIIHALSNSFIDVEETVGKSTESIIKDMLLIKNEGDEKLTNAQMAIREYENQWRDGEITIDEATKGIMEQYEIISGSTSILDDVSYSFQGLISNLSNIDWESPAKRAEALEKIGDGARKAQEKVDEYFDAMTESIEVMLSDIDDPTLRAQMAEAMFLFRDKEKDAAEKEILDNVNLLFDAIEEDLVKGANQLAEDTGIKWDEMGPLGKALMPKEVQVNSVLQAYREDFMEPVSKEMNDLLIELGEEGNREMADAIFYIIQAMEYPFLYGQEQIENAGGTWKDAAREAGGAVPEGVSDGIREGQPQLVKDMLTQFGITSEDISNYTFELDPDVEIKSDITGELKKSIATAEKTVNKNPLNIAVKVDMPNIPNMIKKAGGVYSYRGYTYASGGFPDEGQMFVAREAGPELVGSIGGRTAVANNDQIVSAVSQGVYNAVKSAIPRGGQGSGDLVIRVSESDFARISLRSIENYKRQTGNVAIG